MVLKKLDEEVYFQQEILCVDSLDSVVFGDFSREDIKRYYRTKKQIKEIIRKYQVQVMRQGKIEEIVAMQEFSKYRNLETQQIH